MDTTEVLYPKAYMYRRIVAAKIFMDENFSQKLDLNKISNESHFSRFHFIRLFKSAFGMTPHQYLNSVRIDKAKLSLGQGKSVSNVCFNVGFESISSFSKMFKKSVGMSPQAYQKRLEERRKTQKEIPMSFVPQCFGSRLHSQE